MKLPKAKLENVVMQAAGDEIMVYDRDIDRAYLLNSTSAFVWQMCDGQNDLTAISSALAEKTKQPVNEDIVKLAIEGLRVNNLFDEAEQIKDYFTKTSRRKAIRQIGLATMIALPMVFALTSPTAAHAASNLRNLGGCQPCTANNQCASGKCKDVIPGSDKVCENGSDTISIYTFAPGYTIINAGSPASCSSYAKYCCAGNGVTFSSNRCTCNA